MTFYFNIYISQKLSRNDLRSKIKNNEYERLPLETKDKLNKILSLNTKKDLDIIEKDTDRDNFMSAQEALEYGLIGKIMEKRI